MKPGPGDLGRLDLVERPRASRRTPPRARAAAARPPSPSAARRSSRNRRAPRPSAARARPRRPASRRPIARRRRRSTARLATAHDSLRALIVSVAMDDEPERQLNIHMDPRAPRRRLRELREHHVLGLRVHAHLRAHRPRGRGGRRPGRRRRAREHVTAVHAASCWRRCRTPTRSTPRSRASRTCPRPKTTRKRAFR